MKRKIYFTLLLLLSLLAANAQTWNLVWREDFGVAEDSIIRDFADPNMDVPNHKFGECAKINDGFYGIANSSWWAFNRSKSLCPTFSPAGHFVPGRDHTGNRNGAMLIVNIDGVPGDIVYEQEMKFDVCANHKYKFTIYAASVSFSSNPVLSNLTLNIVNVKDPNNPIVMETEDTGNIPLWKAESPTNYNGDGSHTHDEKPWSEFSIEFTAQAGDILKLQVLNNHVANNSVAGNDFALDDISLYRYDTDSIPEPKLDAKAVQLTSGTKCAEGIAIYIQDPKLDVWKKINDFTYYLWQSSTDNGYTWKDLIGGIDKTSIDWTSTDPKEIARVVVAGGNSASEAEAEAKYIGANGGPTNGCVNWVISSSLVPEISSLGDVEPMQLGLDDDRDLKGMLKDKCEQLNSETHTVTIFQKTISSNPLPAFVWQYSLNGTDWNTLSESASTITHNNSTGSNKVMYRAIVANALEVAQQVAQNGEPDDPCEKYRYTDTVFIGCRGCEKPTFTIPDNVICEGDMVGFKSTTSNSSSGEVFFEYSTDGEHFSKIDFNDDEPLFPKTTSYYRATSDACPDVYSDTITVEVEKDIKPTIDPIPSAVCLGGTVELKANMELEAYNTFAWLRNGDTLSTTELSLTDMPQDTTVYEFVVKGNMCPSRSVKDSSVTVQVGELTLKIGKDSLCGGEKVDLNADINNTSIPVIWEYATDSALTFQSFIPGDSSEAEHPLRSTHYRIRTDSTNCPVVISDTVFAFVEKRASVHIDTLPDWICDGVEVNLYVRTDLDTAINTYAWVVNDDTIPSRPMIYMVRDPFRWLDRKPKEDDSLFYKVTETPLIATSYQFVVFGNLCEPVKDSTHTVVYTEHGVEIEIDKDTVCEGEQVRVTAEYDDEAIVVWQRTHDKITWEDFVPDEVPSELIKRPNELPKTRPTANETPETTTYYRVKVPESALCPTTFSFTVTAHVEKKAKNIKVEEIPATICEGTDVKLEATADIDSTLNSFAWLKNGDTLSTTEMSLTDKPFQASTYTFAVFGNQCEPIKKEMNVNVEEIGSLGLSIDKDSICSGDMARLVVESSNRPDLIWEKSQDSINFTKFDPKQDISALLPTQTTYYRIKAETESNTCPDLISDIVSVNVEHSIDVTVDSIPAYICEGTSVVLKASGYMDPVNTFEWTKDGDTLSTELLELNDTPVTSGTYTLSIHGKNCPSFTKSFRTEVEKQASIALSASETGVCEGTNVTFTAQATEVKGIDWQRKLEGEETFETFATDLSDSKDIIGEESATYRLITTGNISCAADTSEEVFLEVEKNVTFDLTDEVIVCPKTPTIIDAHFEGTPQSVSWQKRSSEDEPYTPYTTGTDPFEVSFQGSAEFKMTYTMKYCPTEEGLFALTIDEGVVFDTLSNDSICSGESIQLISQSGYTPTMTWESKKEGDNDFQIVQQGTNNILVTPTETTRYRLSGTSERGCPAATVYATIFVSQPVDSISIKGGKICLGDSLKLNISGFNDYTDIQWTSSEDDYNTILGNKPSYLAKPSATTNYKATVYNGKCEGTAENTIEVFKQPTILSCDEYGSTSYMVNVESEHNPLYYDFGDGKKVTSNILNNVIYGKTYNITVSTEIGCPSTYEFEAPTYELKFPEYIIPEKKPWEVENLERYGRSTYRIYDRFGKLLYEGEGIDEGWDGTYYGNVLPSTDYWYIVNIPEIDRQFQGHFTLLHE